MYFEAKIQKKHYLVDVTETKTHWKVGICLKDSDADWTHHDIRKEDYQELDNGISFIFKGSSYVIDTVGKDTEYTVYTRGSYRSINIFNDEALLHESLKKGGNLGGGAEFMAGMPGKITKVFVKPGDEVAENAPLLIMEAMKMENEIRAPKATKIKQVHVNEGNSVESGALLISFEE